LADVIQHMVDKTKDEIKKLQWIKAFQERLRIFLERNVKSENGQETMNVEDVIKGCQPIIEEFFRQKDGIMVEFLRVLNMKEESKENVDIASFFSESVECANGLEPFHQSMKSLLEELKPQ